MGAMLFLEVNARMIIEAMNGICAEDDGERHDIPVDETADEAEFN